MIGCAKNVSSAERTHCETRVPFKGLDIRSAAPLTLEGYEHLPVHHILDQPGDKDGLLSKVL